MPYYYSEEDLEDALAEFGFHLDLLEEGCDDDHAGGEAAD